MFLIPFQQIGEQNLAFGIKFNAKGIVDCFENDLESLPSGQRRDIEFNMIEGDFKLFQGKWSIEQVRCYISAVLAHFNVLQVKYTLLHTCATLAGCLCLESWQPRPC